MLPTGLDEERFYVVTGAGFGVHNFTWIERGLRNDPAAGPATTTDVSSAFAVINLAGPRSREVLASVADQSVSNDSFPFMTWRSLSLGLATDVRALRVTFVGELGYELHVPCESAVHLHERLWEAGQEHGIANAGCKTAP